MELSLVLVILHVLSAFVVLLNANKANASSCSWTSGQTHFKQHGRTNILLVSCDMLIKHSTNYMCKLKMLKYDQDLQICNNVASKSSLQISNIESMQSENEIIRVLQNNFVHNNDRTNKKKYHEKKGSITYIKRYEVDSIDCVLLKICKVELMISTPSSNRSCNSEYRVWTGDSVCDRQFWSQHVATNKKQTTNTICSYDRFIFNVLLSKTYPKHNFTSKSYCATLPTILSNAVMLSPFTSFFLFKKQANKQANKIRLCEYKVPLLNGKKNDILGMIVQPAAIAGANFDEKFVICFPWQRYAFCVIEALLAQMGKMGYNASDEQVGRGTHLHLRKQAQYSQRRIFIRHLASTQDAARNGQARTAKFFYSAHFSIYFHTFAATQIISKRQCMKSSIPFDVN
ncbi:hypothetical protein RFI_38749 [Reticulomyxa filosa]|uniref:Uncharacterized protein n=1 Tax=Reticulomyxa filosa TaxID=46433 RepID=X6LB21_RETFI|nr:hypothetical protein RFI_38749 [Reticulomyxa filosa]|eukprot:ETN98738.1 hypothetical protein RFI_38749 [Reticulomyxa filosa]